MAEAAAALAAFALAGNVLQFLQFGKTLIDRGQAIHRAGGNAPEDLQDLRNAIRSLQAAAQQFQISRPERDALLPHNQHVLRVADLCSERLAAMTASLDSIGIWDEKKRWGSIILAFKTTWHKQELEEIEARISALRESLNMALLQSLRDYAIQSAEQQAHILEKMDALQSDSGHYRSQLPSNGSTDISVEAPGDAMLDFVVHGIKTKPQERSERKKRLRNEIIRLIRNPEDLPKNLRRRSQTFSLSQSREKSLQEEFIASFSYAGMDSRRTRIVHAHKKTLRWIFDSPPENARKWSDFRQWLESDSQLYWVTGKAGSGKSTLMKFISQPQGVEDDGFSREDTSLSATTKTQSSQYLLNWAGSRPLITVSFYFWASGMSIEASPRGLYMSILQQILRACPEVIPRVAPIHWEALCLFHEPIERITDDKLRGMIINTIREAQKSYKLCLFIDGLDEFAGPPEDLIILFQDVLSFANVKLCVSSRPWLIFEDAFQHQPSLKLEDLTYEDIKAYITEEFESKSGFRRLLHREPQYAEGLIENITKKSSGVFLWVSLAVRSLMMGMGHDDRVSDMQRRLDLLPPDLERLYSAILGTLDPFYFEHAAQYFKLLGACEAPPAALLFSFADEEDDKYAIKLPTEKLTDEAILSRIETIRRRVNSRCKGLIEVDTGGVGFETEQTVQYLHRSVKDYVESPEVSAKITAASGTFDCHIRLCAANLALLKSTFVSDIPVRDFEMDLESGMKHKMSRCVNDCLEAASAVKKQSIPSMVAMLDNLDETTQSMFSNECLEDFFTTIKGTETLSPWLEHHYGPHFLSLMVQKDVLVYVQEKAPLNSLVRRTESQSVPQFKIGVRPWVKRLISKVTKQAPANVKDSHLWWPLLLDAYFSRPPKQEMVAYLLDNGADVNFQFKDDGTTVWTELLAVTMVTCLVEARTDREVEERWTESVPILRLFISHGAIINKKVFDLALTGMERVRLDGFNSKLVYRVFESLRTDGEETGLAYLRQAANNVL